MRNNKDRPLEDYLCSRCTKIERNWRHGSSKEILYVRWKSMFVRVKGQAHPNNVKYYVQKGIKVCPEWLEFKNFQTWAMGNGFEPHLVLDRKNSDGNYEPSNCQWLTKAEHIRKDRNATQEGNEQIGREREHQ